MVLGGMLGARSAGAATPFDCEFLARSPVFLDRDAVTRCQMDEDGNGLDDEIEQQLAECFVPTFRFDSAEPGDSLLPGEPVAGFTAYRTSSASPEDIVIRFELAAVWRKDGGFAADDDVICCCDDHDGDTEEMIIDVRVFKDQVWRAELVHFSNCWPAEMDGNHPVLYPTAGKHHLDHCAPGVFSYNLPGPAGYCTEPHRGDGPQRTPTGLFRVPFTGIGIFTPPSTPPAIWLPPPFSFPPALLPPDTNILWANVCTYARTGELVPSTRLQPYRLDNLGFGGQTLGGSFYSSKATPIGALLAPGGALTFDPDGDGRDEVDAVSSDGAATAAADLCPLDPGPQSDFDGDHLIGACDPDPNFQQQWVGVGTPAKPAVPAVFTSWNPHPTHAWGGYLDSDQDGSPDGVEACPRLPSDAQPGGGVTVSNRWGEDENWPPDPFDNNLLGALQRDPQCDPYPVAWSQWNAKSYWIKKCAPMGWVTVGQNGIGITTRVSRGASANDPFWTAPKKELPAAFTGQTHRCACRNRFTGEPLEGDACVLDFNSDCYRSAAQAAAPDAPVGRGWRPVDRLSCTRDDDGWCTKLTYSVPRFDSTPSTVSWRWVEEAASFGPTSAKPHFAPEDLVSVPGSLFTAPHTRLVHEYATWTLPDIEAPPAFPDQALTSFFHDPEYDPLHRADALWDVESLDSKRLRASFTEKTMANLVSQHTEIYPGLPCTILTVDQLLARVELWFGPDPVAPEHTAFEDARVLLHDGGVLARGAVLRPAEGNYAGVRLGPDASAGWLAVEPVLVAPVVVSDAATDPGAAAATTSQADASPRSPRAEPGLLAVERSGTRARWSLLAPRFASDTLLLYEERHGGLLNGPVSPTARIVADSAGGTVAVVDLFEGWVESFSPGSLRWKRTTLPAELAGRTDAAVALWGPSLLIAGGASGDVPSTELWKLELYGGGAGLLRPDLPARRGARLSITPRGESVLLVGGADAQGALHDDVWQLAPLTGPPRRVFADTTRAAAFDARLTVTFDAPFDGLVRSVTFEPSRAEQQASRIRTASGWEEKTVEDEPPACPPDDPLGGRLCLLGSAWWQKPGRLPCGAAASCEGAGGALEASATVPGPGAVVAADVDAHSAWIARAKSVERWRFDAGSAVELVGTAALPAKARALGAGIASALVATDAGVVQARATEAGIALDAPLPLCGRPLRLEPLGETTWAVATTLGLAVVAGAPGEPLALRSMSLLVPAGPQLIALDPTPATIALCKKADAVLPGVAVDVLAGVTALAHAGARLLVASGPLLYELHVEQPDAPELVALLQLAHPLAALRADAAGMRAYGTSPSGKHRPIFDLRTEQVAAAGSHDLGDWVRRRDSARLSSRVVHHHAELARVVP